MSTLANIKKKTINLSKRLTPISSRSLGDNLFSTYICIVSWSLVIYIYLISPLDGDKASSLASMFGYSAGIFAPIAAFFLINSWKEETKYNEQISCLTNIHSLLHEIKNKLDEMRESQENYKIIKIIDEAFINYEEKKTSYVALHNVRIERDLYEKNQVFFKEKIKTIEFYNAQISLIKGDNNLNIFKDMSLHYLDNFIYSYLKTWDKFPERISHENVQHLQKEEYQKRRNEILEDMIFSSQTFYNNNKVKYSKISTKKSDILYEQLDKVLEQIYLYRSSLG